MIAFDTTLGKLYTSSFNQLNNGADKLQWRALMQNLDSSLYWRIIRDQNVNERFITLNALSDLTATDALDTGVAHNTNPIQ